MQRKRYYRCLSGTATLYVDGDRGCSAPRNLSAGDTVEVTGEGGIYWAGDVHRVDPTDSLADYVERVASLVEEYEFLIVRKARRACMAHPLGA